MRLSETESSRLKRLAGYYELSEAAFVRLMIREHEEVVAAKVNAKAKAKAKRGGARG